MLLLAPDPQRGKPQCSGRFLKYGTAGAVLRELELQGRVTGQAGRTRAAGPWPRWSRRSAFRAR
ncbi:GPP34 family phosphoprotein [Streptomyces gelaticus]|uniref:GPP34 family phosphoprotein n=1 Tax=Streptomyces gelaticus TaxID=285446 RepID=UPI00167292FF|nr:GPP34 family phosphoprotein [Streptomyces gelaticus]